MVLSLKVRRRVALVLALVLPLAAVVLARFPPDRTPWYPKCPTYTGLGLHCAGCGTARCLHALFNGRLLQAMAYNVLTVACLPFLFVWLARHAWSVARGCATPPRQWLTPAACWAVVALFISFTVLRNIPVDPFALLAPHELSRTEPPE
jgi:hypothetical protein